MKTKAFSPRKWAKNMGARSMQPSTCLLSYHLPPCASGLLPSGPHALSPGFRACPAPCSRQRAAPGVSGGSEPQWGPPHGPFWITAYLHKRVLLPPNGRIAIGFNSTNTEQKLEVRENEAGPRPQPFPAGCPAGWAEFLPGGHTLPGSPPLGLPLHSVEYLLPPPLLAQGR